MRSKKSGSLRMYRSSGGDFDMKSWRNRRILPQIAQIMACLCIFGLASDLRGQEELADGADFNAILRGKLKVIQEGVGVAPGVGNFARTIRKSPGIAIFLDRRIDPDVELSLDLPEMRLEFALREVALRQKMGIVVRDGYVYFGPQRFCRWWPEALDRCGQQVNKLPLREKQLWQAESRVAWNEGATPRELALKIAGTKLSTGQQELLAHDIWGAFEAPPLARWEQLAIVCGGFDLVPVFSNNGDVSLKPLEDGKNQKATINVPASSISEVMESIHRYFPDAKASASQSKIGLEGSSGEIKAIQNWFAAASSPKRPSGTKPSGPVSYLETPVPVPAKQLLIKLAEAAKCELVVASDVSNEAINKAIKPAWKGTREELLQKISEEIGLQCTFREGKIFVSN